MYRLGIDTGGTNTDLVLTNMENGEVFSMKTATTTNHLIEGIFKGIEKISSLANMESKEIKELIYGTTIVVNMIAQKENEDVALITTRGFKDVLEIGRAWRDQNIYNNFMDKAVPLVPRELRFEITERMNFNGEVLEDIQMDQLNGLVRELKMKNIRSVGVCFLHSYRNPKHERMVKEYLEDHLPEVYVSISSDIISQFREYERTSTTVINAYMMPNMVSHLEEFTNEMSKRDIRSTNYMMNANAGVMSFNSAIEKPVTVSDSGPIGGIIAANYLGQQMGEHNLITFDMGGTSCDVSLIKDNHIHFRTDSYIEGFPISIPTVDLEYIGAGGGSMAWCDQGGVLKVGPKSAGAYPGPVCYQRGGTEPTVTDANLVLGRIRPEIFLEDLSDVMEQTKKAIYEKIALPLGLDLYEAAEGIIDVVNANMLRAIKLVSVLRGHNPSEFSLVSFGGAGGLHATKLARELEIPKVIVPYSPGTFAAMGQTLADVKHDFVYTSIQNIKRLDKAEFNRIFSNLEQSGTDQLAKEMVSSEKQILVRSCDVRYVGQAFELNIQLPSDNLREVDIMNMANRFHELHESMYGHSLREDEVEVVNFRVSAIGKIDKVKLNFGIRTGNNHVDIRYGEVSFDGKAYHVPIYDRSQLEPGYEIIGPAIIGEMGATTVIYPEQSAIIDRFLSIIVNTQIRKDVNHD